MPTLLYSASGVVHGFWELNSEPGDYRASTLLTEPLLGPLGVLCDPGSFRVQGTPWLASTSLSTFSTIPSIIVRDKIPRHSANHR